MSYFAEALRDIMDRHDLSAVELARKAGRSPASIDSYRRERSAPTRDALASILPHIPESDRSYLIIARLRDFIPEGYEENVSLSAVTDQTHEPPAHYHVTAGMSSELASAIDQLARGAIQHADIRELVISLTRAGIGAPVRPRTDDET